jgi:hypothetical protein
LSAGSTRHAEAVEDENVARRPVLQRADVRAPILGAALLEGIHSAGEGSGLGDADPADLELVAVLQLVNIVDVSQLALVVDEALEDGEAVVEVEDSDVEACVDQGSEGASLAGAGVRWAQDFDCAVGLVFGHAGHYLAALSWPRLLI